jgi:tetratricopeptide (TPR) repeat protein
MPKKKKSSKAKAPKTDLAKETAAMLAASEALTVSSQPSQGKDGVKIVAGGQGRPDCYGKSEPEFKAMLKEKFVKEASDEQLKFFLMFNSPTITDIQTHTKDWTLDQLKVAATEVLDIENLAVLCIPPMYWVKEVDNSRDDAFLKKGHELAEAKKFQEAFQWFMGALSQMQNNVELWLATAQVLLMTGQLQDGVVHLLEVIRRLRNCDPRKPNLLYNLAGCLSNLNSPVGAVSVLQHALAIDPTHEMSLKLLVAAEKAAADQAQAEKDAYAVVPRTPPHPPKQLEKEALEGLKKDVEEKDEAAVKAFNTQQWPEAIGLWEDVLSQGVGGEMALKIHQNVAKAYDQLDTAENDRKAAQNLALAVMWGSKGPDRVMESLVRSSFGSYLMKAMRRPGLVAKEQFGILKAALEEFMKIDGILKANQAQIIQTVTQNGGADDAAAVQLQMNHLRSSAILQGGQVQLMMGDDRLAAFVTLEQRVGLHLACITWLEEGGILFKAAASDGGANSTEHNAVEALRNAANCFDILSRAHERLGMMAAGAAASGQPKGAENFEKAQRGVEGGLRKSLALRQAASDQARSEIRHLAKPDEGEKDSWTEEQTAQAQVLAQRKSEAMRDRFLEAKLKQELGNLSLIQETDPKAARAFFDASIEAFEMLTEQDDEGLNEAASKEMANSHCLVSQFCCRKKQYGPSRKELKKAEDIFSRLKDENGAKTIEMATKIIDDAEAGKDESAK